MDATPKDVTDAELAVLQALWDSGTSTIRQLTDVLYPECTAAQYATVQKLLDRLEEKHCVSRDRSAWPHRFAAAIDREELIGRRLQAMAEQLCGGSMTPLLLHLLRAERFSPQERQELRAFLQDLHKKPGTKDGGR